MNGRSRVGDVLRVVSMLGPLKRAEVRLVSSLLLGESRHPAPRRAAAERGGPPRLVDHDAAALRPSAVDTASLTPLTDSLGSLANNEKEIVRRMLAHPLSAPRRSASDERDDATGPDVAGAPDTEMAASDASQPAADRPKRRLQTRVRRWGAGVAAVPAALLAGGGAIIERAFRARQRKGSHGRAETSSHEDRADHTAADKVLRNTRWVPPPAPDPLVPAVRQRALAIELASSPVPAAVDVRRLVEDIASGRPRRDAPRRTRQSPRRGVQLLIDRGHGLDPYRDDVELLSRWLTRVVSPAALEVLHFTGDPRAVRALPRSAGRRAVTRTAVQRRDAAARVHRRRSHGPRDRAI